MKKRNSGWLTNVMICLAIVGGLVGLVFLFLTIFPFLAALVGFVPGDFRTPEMYQQWLSEGHDPTEILVQAAKRPEIRELALAKGADVDTALLLYLRRGGDDVSTIKWFIKHDALAKEEDVNRALLSFMRRRDASISVAKLLLDQGADVNHVSEGRFPSDRTTALLAAAKNCDLKAIKFLIANGADVNLKAWRETPLTYALHCDQIDVVKELIINGAVVNVTDKDGLTAIQVARDGYERNLEIFQLLRKSWRKEIIRIIIWTIPCKSQGNLCLH